MRLILLPGLDGTGRLFAPFLSVLPAQIVPEVIAYPTHGMVGYDDLLAMVLAALPQDEPFVLLGESFGGPLSVRVAAQRPHGLRGLILCATFVTCPHRFMPAWVAPLLPPAILGGLGSTPQVKALLGRFATPELVALFTRTLSSVNARVMMHRLREVIRVDVTSELATLDLPILYLQGAQDYIVPHGNLRRMLQIRPDIQHVQLPAPHMVLQTMPERSAHVVTEFMLRAMPSRL